MALSVATSGQVSSWGDSRMIGNGVLIALFAWLLVWCIGSWGYWEDDSYIHLAYARSVSQGLGFMFNGALSNGDTSPLWVLAMALFGSLAPDWVLGGKVLSLVTLLASIWVLHRFIQRLLPVEALGEQGAGGHVVRAVLLGLIFVSPFTLHWAYSGMEAVSASAWIVATSMLLAEDRPTWRQTALACLLVGLGPLLRPEFVLMGPVALPFLWRHMQVVLQDASSVRAKVRLLIGALLLVGPLVLWSAYALHAFGYVMPNTNAAKRAAPGVMVPLRLLQLTALGFPALLLACVGFGWGLLSRSSAPRVEQAARSLVPRMTWPLLAWSALVLVFYVVNHTHVQTRYILVLAPGLLIVAWAALFRRWGSKVLLWMVMCLLAGAGMSVMLLKPLTENKVVHDHQVEELASLIRAQVPPHAPIAVYSIGQIGFLIPNPIVDIGGITQPSAAPYLFGPASDMVAWARRQGAQYYISGDKPLPDAVLMHHMTFPAGGWYLNPKAYKDTEPVNLWRLPMP